MLRINLWGPVMKTPVNDWRQISYKNFDLSGEGARARVFLDFAKGIKKINPMSVSSAPCGARRRG
jgi:hypothetical protein